MTADYPPSTVLGVSDVGQDKTDKNLCQCGISFPAREADNKWVKYIVSECQGEKNKAEKEDIKWWGGGASILEGGPGKTSLRRWFCKKLEGASHACWLWRTAMRRADVTGVAGPITVGPRPL